MIALALNEKLNHDFRTWKKKNYKFHYFPGFLCPVGAR